MTRRKEVPRILVCSLPNRIITLERSGLRILTHGLTLDHVNIDFSPTLNEKSWRSVALKYKLTHGNNFRVHWKKVRLEAHALIALTSKCNGFIFLRVVENLCLLSSKT
jgi:hypothetical protein